MIATKLSDLCDIVIGRTPSRSEPRYWGGNLPWLSIADMNQGRDLRTTKEEVTAVAQEECKLRVVEPGTVVMSFKLSIGKVGITRARMATNEAIAALPIKHPDRLDPSYLSRVLESMDHAGGANRAAMGGTLNKASLASILIPTPPLNKQRRIAAILDKADELRAKRREALAHLDTFIQSIFHSMFEGPQLSWPTLSIEELAARQNGAIRTGPFGSQLLTSEFTAEGIAVLGIDNAVSNKFTWRERRYISPEKYEQLKRYTVHPGDLLVTIMGTLGRCAVVPSDIPPAINTKHLCCITLDQNKTVPRWLHAYFLQSNTARAYLEQTTKGAIMGGLNMGIIKKMPVKLPPLELQQTFATRVAAVERLKEAHRKHLAQLDALFASLQHSAFKGEL